MVDDFESVENDEESSTITEKCSEVYSVIDMLEPAEEESAKSSKIVHVPEEMIRSSGNIKGKFSRGSDAANMSPFGSGSPEPSRKNGKGLACIPIEFQLSPPLGSRRKRSLDTDMTEAVGVKPKKRVRFLEPLAQICE